jgi:hypothetical protein
MTSVAEHSHVYTQLDMNMGLRNGVKSQYRNLELSI